MKLEEILDWVDTIHFKENGYYLSNSNPQEFAREVANRFAKQAFNASREEVKALSGPAGLKYQTFEDYLNSLEND